MSPLRLLSGFFLRLLLYYAAAQLLWVLAGDVYVRTFQAVGTSLFRGFGPDGDVRFAPLVPATPLWETELILRHRSTKTVGRVPIGARPRYSLTASLLALVLATPVAGRRRLWAGLWGLLLIHLWIVFGLWLNILNVYCGNNALRMYDVGPAVKTCLALTREVAVVSPVTGFAVSVLVWVLVTLRRGDWSRWCSPAAPAGRVRGAGSGDPGVGGSRDRGI